MHVTCTTSSKERLKCLENYQLHTCMYSFSLFLFICMHVCLCSFEGKVENYKITKRKDGKVSVDGVEYYDNLVVLVDVSVSILLADTLIILLLSLTHTLLHFLFCLTCIFSFFSPSIPPSPSYFISTIRKMLTVCVVHCCIKLRHLANKSL